MKYLSDLLYVDIPTSLFAGEYKTYNVRLIRPTAEGSAFNNDLTYVDNYETIYTGTIYGTGNTERIYLNDIIASYVYDNSYAMGAKLDDDSYNENPLNVIFQCDVYVVGMFAKTVADGEMILNMYKDPKIARYDIAKLDDIIAPLLINTLTVRTNVYPRIPRLAYSTKNFWVAGLFIAAFLIPEGVFQLLTILGVCILFLVPCFYALKLEVSVGAYKCKKCGCEIVPSYKQALWAMHSGTTRYLKCPNCNQRSWCKKVIK